MTSEDVSEIRLRLRFTHKDIAYGELSELTPSQAADFVRSAVNFYALVLSKSNLGGATDLSPALSPRPQKERKPHVEVRTENSVPATVQEEVKLSVEPPSTAAPPKLDDSVLPVVDLSINGSRIADKRRGKLKALLGGIQASAIKVN